MVVDGNELGEVSLAHLSYQGYESRHWARQHRGSFRRLLPIGCADDVGSRLVEQLRKPQRTIVAGLSDVAGTTHGSAIVALVARGIAAAFADGAYRPGDPVTRGQMATFIEFALRNGPS